MKQRYKIIKTLMFASSCIFTLSTSAQETIVLVDSATQVITEYKINRRGYIKEVRIIENVPTKIQPTYQEQQTRGQDYSQFRESGKTRGKRVGRRLGNTAETTIMMMGVTVMKNIFK